MGITKRETSPITQGRMKVYPTSILFLCIWDNFFVFVVTAFLILSYMPVRFHTASKPDGSSPDRKGLRFYLHTIDGDRLFVVVHHYLRAVFVKRDGHAVLRPAVAHNGAAFRDGKNACISLIRLGSLLGPGGLGGFVYPFDIGFLRERFVAAVQNKMRRGAIFERL